ncbi:unnamed protein product [Adineta ricciae]|uniref:Uncharacterized protein n=1 Tax=Adineta ricciae TaxID=249248 RepID=A0A815LC33_ADIRI|nr:unnamed protein product [Adineta ricciae]
MTEQKRVILVTGANKGIGFEVVKKFLQESSSKTNNNDVILLGSRNIKRGEDAIQQLGCPSNVHLLQLDTSSKENILINNAGIVPREDSIEAAKSTLATNYYGVKMVNEHLIPLLHENGRVINVASTVGSMGLYICSKELQKRYTSSTLTIEELDHLVEDFLSAFESHNLEHMGYPSELPFKAYSVSKAALIALTRIEAREYSHKKNISIYAVCPGFCATDLNNNAAGARSASLGADSILYMINTPTNELENGGFYRDGEKLSQICDDDAAVRAYIEHSKKLVEKIQ